MLSKIGYAAQPVSKNFRLFFSEAAHEYVGHGTHVRSIPAFDAALAKEEAAIRAEKAAKEAASSLRKTNPVLSDPYYDASYFFSF